jgi:DNA-binding Lrp family transcriptional regulator
MRVSLSAPAVKRRVDRLEADGVIPGYTAQIDAGSCGWGTHAFVAPYTEGRMAAAEVRDAVERHPEVEAAYTVAGEASAMLHVRARDTAHLDDALERLRDHPRVTPTQTQIAVSTLFERPFEEAPV